MLELDVNNLSDSELVKRILSDAENFRYLVGKYEQPLRRYLAHVFRSNKDDLEDILQEVFIAAYRNLNDFDQSLKLSTWLYRIAHNKAIDFWRSRQARHLADWDEEMMANIPDHQDFRDSLDNEFLRKNLDKIIANLSDKYREVVILRYIEDKSYEEISDILQKPPGTVAAWLNRAKKELKKLVEAEKHKFK